MVIEFMVVRYIDDGLIIESCGVGCLLYIEGFGCLDVVCKNGDVIV